MWRTIYTSIVNGFGSRNKEQEEEVKKKKRKKEYKNVK